MHNNFSTLLQLETRAHKYFFLLFSPKDLVEEDVMILDTYAQIFVWVGRDANEVEKKEALKTARDYIVSDPSNRDLDSTQLLQVRLSKIS